MNLKNYKYLYSLIITGLIFILIPTTTYAEGLRSTTELFMGTQQKNIINYEKRLSFLEISFLINNSKKNLRVFKKIIQHKNFLQKIKFLILFFSPKILHKFLKK